MKYIIRSNDIDVFSNKIEEVINTEINPTISIMDKLARKALWKGPSRDAFVNAYDDTMNEIKKIPSFMFLYNDFLTKVINNYGDALDEMKKELEKLKEELERKGDLNESEGLL